MEKANRLPVPTIGQHDTVVREALRASGAAKGN
jgi:hypothetical protein